MQAQTALLRVLQEKEVVRLGGSMPRRLDVRVVAATNKPLEEEIAAGRFRRDLHYRLNVLSIAVPPLRDRGDDVALLAQVFLAEAEAEVGRRGLTLARRRRRRPEGPPLAGERARAPQRDPEGGRHRAVRSDLGAPISCSTPLSRPQRQHRSRGPMRAHRPRRSRATERQATSGRRPAARCARPCSSPSARPSSPPSTRATGTSRAPRSSWASRA